ncbi:hypothetical protein AKO1_014643 [Acrasis kona]|uniref:Uncharacterized protein n=1 Tax=Acrasis kona TaxID=1008807 RepID=A0AAW2YKQ3_9EUKA
MISNTNNRLLSFLTRLLTSIQPEVFEKTPVQDDQVQPHILGLIRHLMSNKPYYGNEAAYRDPAALAIQGLSEDDMDQEEDVEDESEEEEVEERRSNHFTLMRNVVTSINNQSTCDLDLDQGFMQFVREGVIDNARFHTDVRTVQDNFLFHYKARTRGDQCSADERRYLEIIGRYPKLLNFYAYKHMVVIRAFGSNRGLVLNPFWAEPAIVKNKESLIADSMLMFDHNNTIIKRPRAPPPRPAQQPARTALVLRAPALGDIAALYPNGPPRS